MMDGRQHTMVTGSTASIHGVCLFLSREAFWESWEDIQQHGFMQKKLHAWLISETSNLRKDEKKGAFAVFCQKSILPLESKQSFC